MESSFHHITPKQFGFKQTEAIYFRAILKLAVTAVVITSVCTSVVQDGMAVCLVPLLALMAVAKSNHVWSDRE